MKETVSDGAREVRWGVDSKGKVQRTEKSDWRFSKRTWLVHVYITSIRKRTEDSLVPRYRNEKLLLSLRISF